MSAPAKHLIIDVRQLAYREAGSGPPIVFLLGLGGNSASWEPQFEAFAGSHRVVAWDICRASAIPKLYHWP
jgi:pimeloyl-ACP methyl ester carboxylesterase